MSFNESLKFLIEQSQNPLLGSAREWKRIQLKEVARITNGYAFSSTMFDREKGLPLIRIRDIEVASTEARYKGEYDHRYLVHPGDLLVGMDGDFKCALWQGPIALLNQRVCRIETDEHQFSKTFLFYLLPAYLDAVHAVTSSITVKHLSSRTLENLPLPLPSLPEQRRIVAEIEKQFTRLSEGELLLRNVVDRAKRLFTSALTQATRLSCKSIPPSWRVTTIGDIAEVGTGATPNRSKREYFDGGTIAWILSGAVNNEYVDAPSSRVTPRALAECNLTIYPPGTLLLAMYGEGQTRGKVAELRIHAVTNQALAAIQFRPAFVGYKDYTRLALSAAYDDIRRRSSGGVQPNLNLSLIRSIKIYLPPFSEVQSIVADLQKISSIVSAVALAADGSLARAARLRQSILAKAFSGQLVPQDPNDEPASVLLERIRRERDQNAKRRQQIRTSQSVPVSAQSER